MRFEFATAGRIVFGPGTVKELPSVASAYGKHAMVVTGQNTSRWTQLIGDLESAGVTATVFGVGGEPTVDRVREGARILRESGADVVVSVGGGSAIDAGKAIAAIAANPGDVLDYLEVVGQGKPLQNTPLPYIAVPTTAGTGSEVTRNAVLGSKQHRVKASLRSPLMLARVAIVDPEVTVGLPRDVTARTGLDALTQLIEPYVSSRANPMTDCFCRDGLRLAACYLARAYENGGDGEARNGMSLASLYGGLALANAGLGVVHGFAAPIGGMFDAPHGAVCAAILPHGMAANLEALRERAAGSEVLGRYNEIAQILTGEKDAKAEDGIAWVDALVKRCGIPSLRAYGIGAADIGELVKKAAQASSMKANPIALTTGELTKVLEAAV